MKYLFLLLLPVLMACNSSLKYPKFKTLDTDFSKGRLQHYQDIHFSDLVKFHGHACDGLVLGTLAMKQALQVLYPNQAIDRTNLRIVSKPSPCLTDVAIYLTGGRYQFHTFYADTDFEGLYIMQRIDNFQAVSVSLKPGIKPNAIDSIGALAVQRKLSPCALDNLKQLEDQFTLSLLRAHPDTLFSVKPLAEFNWKVNSRNDYIKTDILNKNLPPCK